MSHSYNEPHADELTPPFDEQIRIRTQGGLIEIIGDDTRTTIRIPHDMAPHMARALLEEWGDGDCDCEECDCQDVDDGRG